MLFSSYSIQPTCPPVPPHPPNPSHSQVIQEQLKCSCSNSQHSRHGESREKAAPLPPPLASAVRQLCLQSKIYRYKQDLGQPRVGEDLYVSKFLFPCIPSSVSWCVVSDAEEKKCLDLSGNATARHIKGTLRCVRGLNSRDCMVRIKNGTADAASMPADDVYAAGFCHGLELAAGESHNGVDGISYYVVAMARRSSSDLSLLEMHERSSCHPGIRTTVGWTVPIGYLVNTSQISVGEQCNFPKAIGNFFGYSCVPGVKDPLHDPRGNNPKNLCEACIGDENDRHICANNHRERHYGEAGALRCVAENLGDVAFVKHTTVYDNLDGKNQESWALDLELEDLKLLCPDGTEAGLEDYERCHLAAVPANAVVVRMEDKCRVWKFLERVQNTFGNATEGFRLFRSAGYGASNLLFSDATHQLQRVLGSYTSWLGRSYTTTLQAFECEGFC
ncbi:otolith matrix protein 1 isoform X2 [Takifugu flavidus]|uniref:otolith matrix protein 1 isoform X2 n=1 Tax=Takifugu flavidus TaxID=433684 RepID=UPI0025442E0C|nr:otolith matrix protein 1 isoform X2 [Takifugu flavidus]